MKQTIIKALLCVVAALSSLTVNAQVKAFEKYADVKNVSYVYISKYMLSMAGKNAAPKVPGIDIKTLANKLTGIQIITIMEKDNYELMMQMNEEDSKVNIFHHIDKKLSAVIMQVEEDDEVTVIVFSGKFTLDDVMKMTQ